VTGLDISMGRIYISCDVIFDESVFPFTSLHPTAGARYQSEILLSPPKSGTNVFTNPADVSPVPILHVPDSCEQVQLDSGAATGPGAEIDSSSPPRQLVSGQPAPHPAPGSEYYDSGAD
jgi:hypothetical protein